ncbi:MAG: O-antigen ligase family protein [Anaerolineaceae bacterium]|nr:O-antigen ligase family protein [Anaerolineaceae bacterium]
MTSNLQNLLTTEQIRTIVRVVVITGVLLLSAGIAYLQPSTMILAAVLGLPLAIVGGVGLIRWPQIGLILLVLGAVAVPFQVPPLGIVAAILIVLLGWWIVDMVAIRREILLVTSPTIPPLLLFSAVVVLSFIVGQLPWFSVTQVPFDAQIAGVSIFLLSFAAFILVAHQIRELKWLKWMTYLFFICVAPAVILSTNILPRSQYYLWSLYNYNMMGSSLLWVWLVVMMFSQAVFNRKLALPWRVALFVLTLLRLYVGLWQTRVWTSGWAPVLVALAVTIWVARPRFAVPMSMVGGATLIVMFQQIFNAVVIGDNEYSTITRLEAWKIVAEIASVNPILGLGPGNYRNYTVLYPILGWYVRFNSHNNYVDIFAQTGILGLVCYFWFFFMVARLGLRLRTQVPHGGFTQAFIFGALGGLAGSLFAGVLGDWVLPFVYNVGVYGMRGSIFAWLFLGGLVAIEQMLARNVPLD